MAKQKKLPRNPCRIREFHENALAQVQEEFPKYYREDPNVETVQERHVQEAVATYKAGVAVLEQLGHKTAIPYLTFGLVPEFGEGPGEFEGSRLGGLPDLQRTLYHEVAIEKQWPRCGECHSPMSFIGQFDLAPWALPLHEAFHWTSHDKYESKSFSKISAFGHDYMMQHANLFSAVMYHLFVCPMAGYHDRHPSSDAFAFVTHKYHPQHKDRESRDVHVMTQEINALAQSRADLRLIHTDDVDTKQEGFVIKPRAITGYKLRLQLDEYSGDWQRRRELEAALEADHSNLFKWYPSEFQLFGMPRSQQEQRRYISPFVREEKVVPLTPFISFNDEEADVTYQIYLDMRLSTGYTVYGKVDASST